MTALLQAAFLFFALFVCGPVAIVLLFQGQARRNDPAPRWVPTGVVHVVEAAGVTVRLEEMRHVR